MAAAAQVTQRSGRIRLPTLSESWPAPIRPSTPADLGDGDHAAGGGRRPAAVVDQPDQGEGPDHELRDDQQHRDAVDASQVAVAAIGVGRRATVRRSGRGGSTTTSATATAASAQATTGTHSAA